MPVISGRARTSCAMKQTAMMPKQRDDEGLDPAEALVLQIEHEEDVERGDDDAVFEGDAEEEVEADRGADHLGEVGRDDGELGEHPEGEGDRPRIGVAAGLGEVAAGGDGEPRAKRLQDDRHEAGDERGEEQRVAEARAAGERGRPVAGVHVADGDEIARAEEDERPLPHGRAGAHGDRAVHLGKRRRAALGAPAGKGCRSSRRSGDRRA